MPGRRMGLSIVVLGALLACKQKGETGSGAPAPSAAAAPSTAAPATTPTAAAAERVAASATAESAAVTGVPTEGNSKPPTLTEWTEAGEITVKHSGPLGCETKLVREWLRVSCRDQPGKPKIQTAKLSAGKDHGSIPPFIKPGVASVLTQVKRDMRAVYTFEWVGFARKLTVEWPKGAPTPTIAFDEPPPN
jgi:hypothetical protein